MLCVQNRYCRENYEMLHGKTRKKSLIHSVVISFSSFYSQKYLIAHIAQVITFRCSKLCSALFTNFISNVFIFSVLQSTVYHHYFIHAYKQVKTLQCIWDIKIRIFILATLEGCVWECMGVCFIKVGNLPVVFKMHLTETISS